MSDGVIEQMLPLHQPESLKHLQQIWVMSIFGAQPIELIENYFGTQIAMYFAWLDHLTIALWFPACIGNRNDSE
jgi:hypothetical protein